MEFWRGTTLKAAEFKPPVAIQNGRVPGYMAMYSGKLAVMRWLMGRGIQTATIAYPALSSKQPPCKVLVGWERRKEWFRTHRSSSTITSAQRSPKLTQMP